MKDDVISRQVAIDAALSFIVEYCGAAFDEDMQMQLKQRLEDLPSVQPKEQHGRVFKGIVVEYPSYNTYPEYIGKPYFSIKYTENGQEFIGYGTHNPEVLSEYLKEYFMPFAQPDLSEYSDKLWRAAYERGKKEAQSEIIHGYDIKHLMIIAEILRKENLPPERITEVLTDIGRIVSMVRDEFEEMLQKAVEQCKI